MPIKKFVSFFGDDFNNVTFVKRLFNNIISFYGKDNPFVNDITRTLEQDKCFMIPINFNDLPQYHNKKEFFLSCYKAASLININYNKRDMNISYLIIKSWNMVAPEQRNKLLKITDFDFNSVNRLSNYKSWCWNFLKMFIVNNLGLDCEQSDCDLSILRTINDYFGMCKLTKEKIKIGFKSIKSVQREHDRISEKHYMKKTHLVKVKKDTRFKNLRKILPEDFEWIKTRKRLIHETVIQHHCVWSYAEKINRDTSQIYSFVDETGTRFTLEFKVRRNKYCLAQIQGEFNESDTSQASDYVNEILKSSNNLAS